MYGCIYHLACDTDPYFFHEPLGCGQRTRNFGGKEVEVEELIAIDRSCTIKRKNVGCDNI